MAWITWSELLAWSCWSSGITCAEGRLLEFWIEILDGSPSGWVD